MPRGVLAFTNDVPGMNEAKLSSAAEVNPITLLPNNLLPRRHAL